MSSLPLKLGDLEESPFPVVYSFPAEVQLLYSQWFSNIAWRSNYSQVATVQIMTLAKALARSSGYCICIETLTKKYPRVTVNANVLPRCLWDFIKRLANATRNTEANLPYCRKPVPSRLWLCYSVLIHDVGHRFFERHCHPKTAYCVRLNFGVDGCRRWAPKLSELCHFFDNQITNRFNRQDDARLSCFKRGVKVYITDSKSSGTEEVAISFWKQSCRTFG